MALNPKLEQLVTLLLKGTSGVPITLTEAISDPVNLGGLLDSQEPISVFFPECADVLLSLCRPSAPKDEIDDHFNEYFSFRPFVPDILLAPPAVPAPPDIDPDLAKCSEGEWPPHCCLPSPCVFLDGERDGGKHIRRLFPGDLYWAYCFEAFGIPRLLGVILDDYAIKGNFPISNGFFPGAADDQTLMVLEAATRQTKTGQAPTHRDRESAFRRGIGQTMRTVQVESAVNRAIPEQLARLVLLVSQFNSDKRLSTAVRGAASASAPVSVATLISIRDTIVLLQHSFRQFYYGRTYTITLAAIVWIIAGMSLIRALRHTLGIPDTLDRPEDYLTAAYEKYLGSGSTTSSNTNRWLQYRDWARSGRGILLKVEMLDTRDPTFNNIGGLLDRFLNTEEALFEEYRNKFKLLTGIDLGTTQNPALPHQA